MIDVILPLLQVLLAGALAWACFCRMAKTSARTLREIRWAIWFLWFAASAVLAAPVLPLLDPAFSWPAGTTPAGVWLMLLAAVVAVQLATSRHWRGGTPRDFERHAGGQGGAP